MGSAAVLEITTVIVRVVVPIVPLDVTMTLQLPSCVASPDAAESQLPMLVSTATPVSLSSPGLQSLRILTVNVPCALPRPGRVELGPPSTAPCAHVAPTR